MGVINISIIFTWNKTGRQLTGVFFFLRDELIFCHFKSPKASSWQQCLNFLSFAIKRAEFRLQLQQSKLTKDYSTTVLKRTTENVWPTVHQSPCLIGVSCLTVLTRLRCPHKPFMHLKQRSWLDSLLLYCHHSWLVVSGGENCSFVCLIPSRACFKYT